MKKFALATLALAFAVAVGCGPTATTKPAEKPAEKPTTPEKK